MEQKPNTKPVQTAERDRGGEIDLLDLFLYLRQHILALLIALLVGAVAAGTYTYFCITPRYTASAKMYMVAASSDSVVNLSDLNIGTSLSSDYCELMKVYAIYEEVQEKLDLPYSYEYFQSLVSVSNISDTRIVQITVTDTDPQEAMDIANAVAVATKKVLPDVMSTAAPSIAEYARLPKGKSYPNVTGNAMKGGLICFAVLLFLFVIQYLRDDTVKTAEDVEALLGLKPLTIIPESDIGSLSDKKEKEMRQRRRRHRGITGRLIRRRNRKKGGQH